GTHGLAGSAVVQVDGAEVIGPGDDLAVERKERIGAKAYRLDLARPLARPGVVKAKRIGMLPGTAFAGLAVKQDAGRVRRQPTKPRVITFQRLQDAARRRLTHPDALIHSIKKDPVVGAVSHALQLPAFSRFMAEPHGFFCRHVPATSAVGAEGEQ